MNEEARIKTKYQKDIYQLTHHFSLDFYVFLKKLKIHFHSKIIIDQVLRSATSVGANTREAEHSISKKALIHRLTISLKETKETNYWIKFLQLDYPEHESQFLHYSERITEIIKILHACVKKLKEKEYHDA